MNKQQRRRKKRITNCVKYSRTNMKIMKIFHWLNGLLFFCCKYFWVLLHLHKIFLFKIKPQNYLKILKSNFKKFKTKKVYLENVRIKRDLFL